MPVAQIRRIPAANSLLTAPKKARERLREQFPVIAVGLVGIAAFIHWNSELQEASLPYRIVAAIILVMVGIALARGIGRVMRPIMVRRLDAGTAGVLGFGVRLATTAVTVIISLNLVGLDPQTITLGASFTAVVLGLASQQTFGNVIAGLVLLSARPFTVGDRVRFNGFGMDVEGTVESHGLLYVTCSDGEDKVLVPNNTALTMSVRPIREPQSVDLVATFPADVDPEAVQQIIMQTLTVATREAPDVTLEEFLGEDVRMGVKATPVDPIDGPRLTREVLRALGSIHGHEGPPTVEFQAIPDDPHIGHA